MNERIRQFLLTENKSSAQFAEEIGVQPSGISHILSGRNKPSLDFIIKMLERYRNLSVDWLLFGHGTMYREGEMMDLFENNRDRGRDEENIRESESKNSTDKPEDENNNVASNDKHTVFSSDPGKSVRKIVWFYRDNSFEEFYPSDAD